MNRNQVIILLLIILGALLLRVYELNRYDFWYDECCAIQQGLELDGILNGTALDTTPPLYYLLLHTSMRFGRTPTLIRLPSLLFGIFAVPLIFLFGARLWDPRTGLWAALVIAVNPVQIFFSRELKAYMLFSTLALASMLLTVSLRNAKGIGVWLAYGVLNAVLLYAHYFGIFVILAEQMFLLCRRRTTAFPFRYWSAAHFLSAILFAPWLPVAWVKTRNVFFEVDWWAPPVSLKRMFLIVKGLITGYGAEQWNYWLLGILLGLFSLWVITRERDRLDILVPLLTVFAGPLIMLYLISKISGTTIVLNRTVLFCGVPLYLIWGRGFALLSRPAAIAALALLLGLSLPPVHAIYANRIPIVDHCPGIRPRKQHQAAAQYVKARFREGDVIGHSCRSSYQPFWFYLGGNFPQYNIAVESAERKYIVDKYGFAEIEEMWGPTWPVNVRSILPGKKRLWFVLSFWDIGRRDQVYSISINIRAWLDAHFTVLDTVAFDGLSIFLYDLEHPKQDWRNSRDGDAW